MAMRNEKQKNKLVALVGNSNPAVFGVLNDFICAASSVHHFRFFLMNGMRDFSA